MVTLGLLPPYSLEDVRRAYHDKSQSAHPDRGGSIDEFIALKEAFERANEYVKFRSSRAQWLAGQVERYARQEDLVSAVRRWGGEVEVEAVDWLKRSFGDDFSIVTERLVGIHCRGQADGDALLAYLGAHKSECENLRWLDVSGSKVSDLGLSHLASLSCLKRLDLGGTQITTKGLVCLDGLKELEWLNVAGTEVGWWARQTLRWRHPRLQVVAGPP
jgi:hypothetical protein